MVEGRVFHYVKPNETTRVPRYHVFLDTEAKRQVIRGREIQTWRVAVASFYAAPKGRKAKEHTEVFRTPTALWEAVSAHAGRRSRTVVWAHNLGYDVRISDAIRILPRQGWKLVGHNMASRGTWLHWARDGASIVMVDSSSVFPTTLAAVGKCFGMGKTELPADDDSEQAWITRCRVDVDILRTAILAYLEWIEAEDLGNWQMTGSGQAWATFRHRFMTHKMLVHADDDALAAERRAMWTGRCEAFWHGQIRDQYLLEYDMHLAYPNIVREVPLPVRLVGPMPARYPWRNYLASPKVTFLAEVRVTTETPVVPAESDGRIIWPVGEFTTTLWAPEIRAALDAGATVEVVRGWLYRTEPALAKWADWIIGLVDDQSGAVPAWQRIIAKYWARALIGRLSMTYTEWQAWGSVRGLATKRWTVYDVGSGEEYDAMQVGSSVWREVGTVEWPESMPAITGYVMSVARARLWEIMQAAPADSVLYVDTDSVMVTARHRDAMDQLAASPIGYGLRLKKIHEGFAIWGPRQIVTGEQVRISGIPVRALQLDRNVFRGEVWESLPKATRDGHFDRVVITPRQWTVHGVDRRREGSGVGWTRPRRLTA